MELDYDILNGTDEFPYPNSIIGTDFKNFSSDFNEIDEFLYINHRFNSLDSLIKDLNHLSTSLNETLLNLVNDEYNDFINLGKSINSGNELIELLLQDLQNFKYDLIEYYKKFDKIDQELEVVLKNRQVLMNLKTVSKLNLIIHDQMMEFDNLISELSGVDIKSFKKLTSLYISMNNIVKFLTNFTRDQEEIGDCLFHENYITNKIGSIRLEFKSYLDQLIKKALNKKDKTDRDSNLMLELLKVYELIGKQEDVLSILKK
ncbi:Conserved oligomeric Golgi complex subunit 2 [Candida viswanathii]|uniref:Conserved oligomeric Golgi complex subunit 2 n=1 Tax=Candida viswanathii TaxID=5486 RepID=A0A367Y9Y4_9ASCO|nr:Conserved oligomeric Golgi complex subunit 2 [Candida viswanathii]